MKEAYAEAGVPILRDKPLFRALSVNGAVPADRLFDLGQRHQLEGRRRLDRWSTACASAPTRSRDIRAPNISELFNPGSNGRLEHHQQADRRVEHHRLDHRRQPQPRSRRSPMTPSPPAWCCSRPSCRASRVSVDLFPHQHRRRDRQRGEPRTCSTATCCRACRSTGPSSCSTTRRSGSAQVQLHLCMNMLAQKSDGVDFELSYRAPIDRLGAARQVRRARVGHLRCQSLAGPSRPCPTAPLSVVDSAGAAGAVAHWQANLDPGLQPRPLHLGA